MSAEYGKGYSHRNLDYFKKFYLLYRDRISQTLFAKFGVSQPEDEAKTLLAIFAELFEISWSHYLLLMKIREAAEREYYESEAAECNWSFRELQRQYDSSLYERLMLIADKKCRSSDC